MYIFLRRATALAACFTVAVALTLSSSAAAQQPQGGASGSSTSQTGALQPVSGYILVAGWLTAGAVMFSRGRRRRTSHRVPAPRERGGAAAAQHSTAGGVVTGHTAAAIDTDREGRSRLPSGTVLALLFVGVPSLVVLALVLFSGS